MNITSPSFPHGIEPLRSEQEVRCARLSMVDVINRGANMSGHTPGPWAIFRPDDSRYLGIDTADGKRSVVIFGSYSGIQHEADARLIASAPDLLAALEAMREAFRDYSGGGPNQGGRCGALVNARAAIAKATGTP